MIPPVDDRTENREGLEQAYRELRGLDERYDDWDFEKPAELIEDTVQEEPEQSVTMSYQQAYHALEGAEQELDMDTEDRKTLTDVRNVLKNEEGSFPAMGKGRHYSLDERRKNL